MVSQETVRTVVIAATIWIYSAYQVLLNGNFYCLINFLPIIPLAIIFKFGFENDLKRTRHFKKINQNKKSSSSTEDDFYKLDLLSKSMDENSLEDLLITMSLFPTDAIEIIPTTENILEENLIPEKISISPESDESPETVLINFNDNNILQNSPHNNILANNMYEVQTHNETVEISEIFPEDISEFENLYRQNQQDAFEEYVKPNFNITRLPTNSYCAEWLLKHAQCCIGNWKLDNSDYSMDSL
ncbi:hypothetical protein HNY73_017777 [Argiope bruennichi]|uniref:Transmembrane protein n=1 Tax=Argiope bruennichi TaxID=94029 RepID=A0A8T0EC51_ARGBR|nr:hypothetical protein HNY73_017777 [Argiope bruennichi]